MSFHKKQNFRVEVSAPIEDIELVTLETGELVKQFVRKDKELPDPEMFDLKNIHDAGMINQLEEINSKVISASEVNFGAVVRKYSKNNQTQTTTKE